MTLTNVIILSSSLISTNQQAIVGESNGRALIATQEMMIQQVELGYMKGGKPISIGSFSRIVGSPRLTTNAVPFAFTPRPSSIVNPTNAAPALPQVATNAPTRPNTNSPAFQRRLEREQRMRPSTNAPPVPK